MLEELDYTMNVVSIFDLLRTMRNTQQCSQKYCEGLHNNVVSGAPNRLVEAFSAFVQWENGLICSTFHNPRMLLWSWDYFFRMGKFLGNYNTCVVQTNALMTALACRSRMCRAERRISSYLTRHYVFRSLDYTHYRR